jgi:uncharacterized iron-regulated membrane protein
MKLAPYAYTRFWDVHAWAGVITGLLVYVMFVLGSLVLFYEPLTIWKEPIKQRPTPQITSLQSTLELAGELPNEFYYYLPKDGRGLPKVAYFLPGTTSWRALWLDVERNQVVPQRELAAAYLYDLHYLWHEVTGYGLQYGAGILVFGFLLAIVTGVLIHLKDLLRKLHRFRPDRTPRVMFSDLHKVTSVFGLPFQLVYALTGTLMALSPLFFDLSIDAVFGGDAQRAARTSRRWRGAGVGLDRCDPGDRAPCGRIRRRLRGALHPRAAHGRIWRTDRAPSFAWPAHGRSGSAPNPDRPPLSSSAQG